VINADSEANAMKIEMPCGRGTVEFAIPAGLEEKVTLWASRASGIIGKPHEQLEQALANPMGVPPLEELAKGKKTACVVISDKTRPVPNKLILPPLLAKLEKAGIARDDITILIANGMHGPTIDDALIELLGPEIIAAYRIVNHDCQDKKMLRKVGEAGGWSIEVNRIYLDAELKILTGLIEPHPFAGYSGGGKSILPGISGLDTMRYMHSFNLLDQSSVAAARLEGNPFHQLVMQTAKTAGVDFVVNLLQDQERRLTGIFAGGPGTGISRRDQAGGKDLNHPLP
jgi:nickel-dependent lactate racemase